MKYKDFGDISEEDILKAYPRVIEDVKKQFNLVDNRRVDEPEELDGVSQSRGYARVLKDTSMPTMTPSVNNEPSSYYGMGGYSINGDVRSNNGASYVLVVAAIIALIAIVYIVSTTILNMVGGLYS